MFKAERANFGLGPAERLEWLVLARAGKTKGLRGRQHPDVGGPKGHGQGLRLQPQGEKELQVPLNVRSHPV